MRMKWVALLLSSTCPTIAPASLRMNIVDKMLCLVWAINKLHHARGLGVFSPLLQNVIPLLTILYTTYTTTRNHYITSNEQLSSTVNEYREGGRGRKITQIADVEAGAFDFTSIL